MSSANLTNLIIGVVVLALLLSRQLITRRLSESYRLLVILAVIGIVEFADFLRATRMTTADRRGGRPAASSSRPVSAGSAR